MAPNKNQVGSKSRGGGGGGCLLNSSGHPSVCKGITLFLRGTGGASLAVHWLGAGHLEAHGSPHPSPSFPPHRTHSRW